VNRCYNTVKKRIGELAGKLEELFSDRELRLLFRQRAKRIVEELKKCAASVSFFEGLIYYADMGKSSMSHALGAGHAYQSGHERKSQRKRDRGSICVYLNEERWFAK
jgi:hypothetical protein